MKKIPTLFKRTFENRNVVEIFPEVTEGMGWVLNGDGVATEKIDGACCAIIDGQFYKRYDAKNGKPVPNGAIKCQEKADPITGHLPCWVKCSRDNPADKWFWRAYDVATSESSEAGKTLSDGTYEAVGKHFNGNPYDFTDDILMPHGTRIIHDLPRTFDGIRNYLASHEIEGVVFWKDGKPQCKIKRTDFGFKWGKR